MPPTVVSSRLTRCHIDGKPALDLADVPAALRFVSANLADVPAESRDALAQALLDWAVGWIGGLRVASCRESLAPCCQPFTSGEPT